MSFDHGAQYFTVRDPVFAHSVEKWVQQGIVAEWTGEIVEIDGPNVHPKTDQPLRYVGVPGMTAMARDLAAGIPVQFETRITRLERKEQCWTLTDSGERSHGPFDHIVLSLPAPQTADLIQGKSLEQEVRAVPMTPCWAVLIAFKERIELAWDGAFVSNSPLAWVARNSSKPGRDPSVDSWVLHASPSWSAAHLEDAPELVRETLRTEFAQWTGRTLPSPIHFVAHRWLYSATPLSLDRQALFDRQSGLVICGDWLAGGRVEGAFRSGIAAADCLLRHVGWDPS
jgi:predicted NAD/FAD-dependent oxidoreductase